MKNVTVLNFSPQFNNFVGFPYVYSLLRHYYEVNGSEKFNWIDPKYLKQDIDPSEVASWLESLNLDYLFCSLYIWNYSYSHLILKEYRKRCPNTIIVAGGPNVFPGDQYFKDHPWINVCCDHNVYGEVFTTDLLDGNDWNDVTGAVWPGGKSTKPFIIRDFEWAPSPYANSLDLILKTSLDYKYVGMPLETSRGCPFKCSFCEWGGGIGTKMNKRKLEDIKADIDAMIAGEPGTLQICDSNFGYWEEDIEVMRHITDYKKALGYPKSIEIYGWSKNNNKHHYEILKLMYEAGFTQHYAVSLQSIKKETLVNVRRVDKPIEDRLAFARKVNQEIGTTIQIEIILGLPGDTLNEYYESLNLRNEFKDFINFVWWVLPNTEAHTPEYRKEHGLITAWSETVEAEFEEWRPQNWGEIKDYWEYVIGTNTLTPNEWLEAFLLDRFYVSAKQDELVWDTLEECRNSLGVTPKEFWKPVIDSIHIASQNGWKEMWDEAWEQFNQYIVPNSINKSLYAVTIQGKSWKFPELSQEFFKRCMPEILEYVKINIKNTSI